MIEVGEVDAGSAFGGVPHAFADNGEGDTLAVGSGGPGVAGDVEGERKVELKQVTDFADALIEAALDVAVAVVTVVGAQHGQQIGRGWIGVLAQESAHVGFDFHLEELPRLAAAIDNHLSRDILFAKVAHVDECHAAGVKAKEKEVASQRLVRVSLAEVQSGDAAGFARGDGAFGRLGALDTDALEGLAGVVDKSLVVRLVVDGA